MGSKSSSFQMRTGILSLLFILSLLLSSFFHHSFAISINRLKHDDTYNGRALLARTIPSYDDISEKVVDEQQRRREKLGDETFVFTTVFYTKLKGGIEAAECWGKANKGDGKYLTFNQAISESDLRNYYNGAANEGEKQTIQKLISRALADAAEEDIILLIDDGQEPDPQSTWILYEFPAIQHDNPLYTRVKRIDPKTGSEQVIWEQGRTPDLPKPRDS